jgi:hypothetical protein
MTIEEYFHTRFKEQFRQIRFTHIGDVFGKDADKWTGFFGGHRWRYVRRDLSRVPIGERAPFVLCLFMVVVTDQALYTYFHEHYAKWRERTAFPKFGWGGFGPHHENPMQILWAPERQQVLVAGEVTALLPDFVTFWIQETTRLLETEHPEVPAQAFFSSITTDKAWREASEGQIIPELKRLMSQWDFTPNAP